MERPENRLIFNLLCGRSTERPYFKAVSGILTHPRHCKITQNSANYKIFIAPAIFTPQATTPISPHSRSCQYKTRGH